MEVTICLSSQIMDDLLDYYLNVLGVFEIYYQDSDNEVFLLYRYDKKIKLILKKDTVKHNSVEIMLQVPNSNTLFKYIEGKKKDNCGIIIGAYGVGGQDITFLSAPPGDYFITKDPDGNKIIFYDKFEERINLNL